MADEDYGTDEVKGESQKSPAKILKGPPQDTITSEDSLEQKISLRMEIMLKKERQRQEEEANFTYKPKLFTSHKKEPKQGTPKAEDANSRENRFDKLYGDALKRHITHTIKEESKDKDLTFTPKVTKRASSASRSNSASRSGSRSASRERGSTGNASDNGSQTPKSARKSVEPEKPSFQPAITKRAKSIERTREKEVTDRLYEHGLHLKEKIERKRVESEQKVLESCSFAPKISTDPKRSASASRLDVVDRMNRFDEIRKKKLQDAVEQKKEAERGYSFQPTLMAKRPTTPTQQPFHERLAVPHEKPFSHAAEEAMANLTFKPQLISKRSPSPNTTRSSLGEFKSVHERLYREGEEHRRELENELQSKRHQLDSELTFKPQIITPVAHYSSEPVFDRLNIAAERYEVKAKLERIKSEVTKDWTFHPHISENSKKILGTRRESHDFDMYERQMQEQRRIEEELLRKKEEIEQQKLREATFAPTLPESSKELAKKKISMHNLESASTDVYSRLANAQSPTALHTSMVQPEGSVTSNGNNPNLSRSIILPEKVLSQVFERLATPSVQQMDEYNRPTETVKKIVVPEKEADKIFNRLSSKKTMSFTFKHEGGGGGGNDAVKSPNHGSPTGKQQQQQPLTEAALLERIAEDQKQNSNHHHHHHSRAKKDTDSQVSSITNGSNNHGPKPRTPSASKASSAVTPNKTTTTGKSSSSAVKKSANKIAPTTTLASPPVVRGENAVVVSPMPPAPPATAVKGTPSNNGGKDYYDDLAKKLETSLNMIQSSANKNGGDGANSPPPAQPQPTKSPNSVKKQKESQEFINSIPTVPDNGELSD